MAQRASLDVVTVVYRRELNLLRLQARSLDRFLDPTGIDRILVIVNDLHEAECAAAVEAMRGEYGRFADRLEVVRPEALAALRPAAFRPRGLGQHLRNWVTLHRQRYPLGVKPGWRGNRGWSVQQAFKLAAARFGESDFLLILDAKNHLVRPASVGSFVSAGGRARSYLSAPNAKRQSWIDASFARLGLDPPRPGTPAPPTVTPVCIARDVLRECLDDIEARVGPVEAFFPRRRLFRRKKTHGSEFMLIYAGVTGRHGAWGACFDDGLVPPATIFRNSPAEEIDAVLSRVERDEADFLSVHVSRLETLGPGDRARLERIWAERGLAVSGLMPPAAAGPDRAERSPPHP